MSRFPESIEESQDYDPLELAFHLSKDPRSKFLMERRRLELNFRDFVQAAWHIIEPSTPLVMGPHIDAVCLHLQAVTETYERLKAMTIDELVDYQQESHPEDIRYLVVNVPPRSGKSTIISVMWPAWEWTRDPTLRYLTASYAAELAVRDSMRTRDVIQSQWYQERWGHVFQLGQGQSEKHNYDNDKTGKRLAIGVGGAAMGSGGDRIMVDDPHAIRGVESDVQRENTIRWFDTQMSTRMNDPRRSCMVVVQQRVHDMDLAGHLIEQNEWVRLNLPMEYEGEPNETPIGWRDWRTEEGEFLYPGRFGQEEKRRKLLELGAIGYAGQFQQRPVPAGGAIYHDDAWQYYDPRAPLPRFRKVAAFVDGAYKKGEENDYTVMALWGISAENDDMYLLDLVRKKMEFPELVEMARRAWAKWKNGFRCGQFVIEDKVSGTSLIQTLRKQSGIPIVEYRPDQDKVSRAHAGAGYQQAGKLFLPNDKIPLPLESHMAPHIELGAFLREHSRFPRAAHDDCVDTTSIMLLYWVVEPPERGKGRRRQGRLLRQTSARGWFNSHPR